MHHTVDEQRRGAADLARFDPAPEVTLDPVDGVLTVAVAVKFRDVQPKLACIAPQVFVLESPLAVKKQVVHLPEPALERRGLRRAGRRERVRVDLGQREVPEREPYRDARLALDTLDRPVRLPRVRALVVAVLDDSVAPSGPRTWSMPSSSGLIID